MLLINHLEGFQLYLPAYGYYMGTKLFRLCFGSNILFGEMGKVWVLSQVKK